MLLKLDYNDCDFFKNKVVNHDKCVNATMGQLYNALEFVERRKQDTKLSIIPGGYTESHKYRYPELRVFKDEDGLNIAIPSPIYGRGETEYVTCKDVRDCYSKLESLVRPL